MAAGGDNIHRKQLFSYAKRHDILHVSVLWLFLVFGQEVSHTIYVLKIFDPIELIAV